MIHRLKQFIFPLLFGISYVMLLMTVFFGWSQLSDLGTTIGLQIALLMLLSLSLQIVPSIYSTLLLKIVWVLWVIWASIGWVGYGPQYALFLWCTHLVIGVYIWEWFHLVRSSKTFHIWRSAHWWLSTSALLLALTYTSTLWTASTGINLNCIDLRDQTIGVVTRYMPSLKGTDWFTNFLGRIDTFSSQTFGEVIGTNMSSINSGVTNDTEWTWTLMLALFASWYQWWWLSWLETLNSGSLASSWLLTSLLGYQTNLINGLINNQELIDAKVCDLTLNHIKDLTSKSDVQLIGFVLLVLWLSLLIRSIMFIIGIINFVLLSILFMTGWFVKSTHPEDVEVIDV